MEAHEVEIEARWMEKQVALAHQMEQDGGMENLRPQDSPTDWRNTPVKTPNCGSTIGSLLPCEQCYK